MKRAFVLLLGVILVLGVASGAGAGKKKRIVRKAQMIYDGPAIGSGDLTGTCIGSNGCVMFPTGPKEKFIDLEVIDDAGLPVAATVGQDTDPSNNFTELVGRFCGETEEPLPIKPGVEVVVWLWVAPSANPPCPGIATSGTVKAALSNLP